MQPPHRRVPLLGAPCVLSIVATTVGGSVGAVVADGALMLGAIALVVAGIAAFYSRRGWPDRVHLSATMLASVAVLAEVFASSDPRPHDLSPTTWVALLLSLVLFSAGVLWEALPTVPPVNRGRAMLDSSLAASLIAFALWNLLLIVGVQPRLPVQQTAVISLLLLVFIPTAFAAAGLVNDPTDGRMKSLVVACVSMVLAAIIGIIASAAALPSWLVLVAAMGALGAVAHALMTASTGVRPEIDLLERFSRRTRVLMVVFGLYISSVGIAMFLSSDHLLMGVATLVVLVLAVAMQALSSRENLALHRRLSAQVEYLASSEDRFRTLAWTDELTGLLNRRSFVDRLESELAAPRPFAVLFVDLDRFKEINDTLGHDAGDELLIEVGNRISSMLGDGVSAARFGGDEFCLLVPNVGSERAAIRTGERVLEALSEPVLVAGLETFVAASVGIALSEEVSTPTQLLSDSDAAMYEAKASGRRRVALFDQRLRQRSAERLRVANELPRAIRNELEVHYQPVVDLDGGAVVGFEALVRWQHPERGLVPPSEFIEVAEDTGQIVALGASVLQVACLQLGTWIRSGLVPRDATIAVNLSPRQLGDSGLAACIADTLVTSGLETANLILEITESALMADGADIDAVIAGLWETGIRFSVDDFGTGYSSLSYLKRFPVHALKIDRSFVDGIAEDEDDMVIVDAVVSLAKSLGLDCVAEGIERETQFEYLHTIGCTHAQGFFIARPMAARETSEWLATRTSARKQPV